MRDVRTEIERLQDRIEELESLLGLSFIIAPKLALSGMECKILGMLIKQPLMTRSMALSAMYGYDVDNHHDGCVDVPLHKVRKKLHKFGIKITTRQGDGWFLSSEARAKLMPLLESCFELNNGEIKASLVEAVTGHVDLGNSRMVSSTHGSGGLVDPRNSN
jgi:hypothetical protein